MSAPNRDWWTQSQPNPAVVPPATEFSTGAATPNPYKWPVQSANTGMGPRQPPIPTNHPWGQDDFVPPEPPEPPVVPGGLAITTTSPLPPFVTKPSAQPYSYQLQATGGSPPYTWVKTTSLPNWMTVSTSGLMTGMPNQMLSYNAIGIRVTDDVGATVLQYFTLTTLSDPLVITYPATLPTMAPGQMVADLNIFFNWTGGLPPYDWTATGVSGVFFAGTLLYGTAPYDVGDYPLTVTVTDGSIPTKTASKNYTLSVVVPPIQFSDPYPNFGTVNLWDYVTFNFSATGGVPPLSLTCDNPPSGLYFGDYGSGFASISGNPDTAGSFEFTVTATDNIGTFAQVNAYLEVIDTSEPPPGYVRMYDGKKE